ncbi:MAG TPA: 50S ribosomal protein L29 [Candidatus Sulfotelmatobacter sp.]|nr:50S ribosomal protein L29 [Candidatus Sulfotelmatobacter sp.]
MAILRLKEIDNMSQDDRNKKLTELRAELSRMRTMIHAGGAVENYARIIELRKTIAQILTIESEQKRGIRQKQDKAERQSKKTKKKKKEQSKKEDKDVKTKKPREAKKTAEAEETKETKK